jgi:hypothetical protein
MRQAGPCEFDELDRYLRLGRQPLEHRTLERLKGREPRMPLPYVRETETAPPRLAQRLGRGPGHSGKRLDPVKLPERRLGKRCLNGLAEDLGVNGGGEASGEPGDQLFEGHGLGAVRALRRRPQPHLPGCKAPMRHVGLSLHAALMFAPAAQAEVLLTCGNTSGNQDEHPERS